ncbi:MAG: hippurate hydrolase [Candidatus Tokpelaia sp. JSC085]|nr:MAG: hippurate hydrolase [Candidatus Tokpelaia sp. JSC085]
MNKIQNHINNFLPDMIAIRHDLHAYPELSNAEYRTSDIVAELLEKWGYEVSRGIGKTGVVGTLHIGSGRKSIGLRADMDALPIYEQTNLAYMSKNAGVMHACGHDGHTTILLTAARYLAETKKFSGTVHLIFQPAEEGFAGAKAMIDDGLFERYPCDRVYGLHNWPGRTAGEFYFKVGPMMASVDTVHISIEGRGGHGAMPENTIDPIVAGASVVMALQTIISRNIPPVDSALITIGSFQGGSASNIIPDLVKLELTIRTFSQKVRVLLKKRVHALVSAQATSYGAQAGILYETGYPPLVNHADETTYAQKIAENTFGKDKVVVLSQPVAPSEDFAFMLEKCPGSYFFLGNGESAELHNPHYVFNDEIIPIGASLWGALVESYLHKI